MVLSGNSLDNMVVKQKIPSGLILDTKNDVEKTHEEGSRTVLSKFLSQPPKLKPRTEQQSFTLENLFTNSTERLFALDFNWLDNYPYNIQSWVKEVRRRNRIDLLLMPMGMSKRLSNTSRMITQGEEKVLIWKIEWRLLFRKETFENSLSKFQI